MQFNIMATLLASSAAIFLSAPALAADIVIADGEVETNDLDLGGTDTLTIEEGGRLSVDGEAIEWDGPSTDLRITNNGIIESIEADTRAFDTGGDETEPRTLTFVNGASGIVRAEADAIRIDTDIAGGTVTLDNAGTIISTVDGQALDFDSIESTTEGQVQIINRAGGIIRSTDADAVRPGENAVVTNFGTIDAGATANGSSDGVDLQAHSATIVNKTGGLITGARHGITTDTDVYVLNEAGATIVGRNGSGVGSDGSGAVINYGTIRGEYDGSGAGDGDGIDFDAVGYVENYGVIEALGAAGIRDDGRPAGSDAVTFANGGTFINHEGARVFSVGAAVAMGVQATVVNEGEIIGSFVAIGTDIGDDTIINAGRLVADTYGLSAGSGDDTVIIRRGSEISGRVTGGEGEDLLRLEDGAIFATGDGFELLQVDGGAQITGSNAFRSTEILSGAALTVADSGALELGEGIVFAGGGALTNEGVISATGQAVTGSVQADNAVNAGAISAPTVAIALMAGDDRLTLRQGSAITGSIDGGEGDDVLRLENAQLSTQSNFETLEVAGASQVLGDNAFSLVSIEEGASLTLGDGGTSGSVGGEIELAGELIVDRANVMLFDGRLSGAGTFAQAGAGTTTLRNLGGFTGTLDVRGGRLLLGGPSGANVDVTGGRFVSAAGIGGLSVSGGTVGVGDAFTALPVAGDLVVEGGNLEVKVAADGRSDLYAVDGTANLLGGSVVVLPQGDGFAPRTSYTVLTAEGGVSGTFDDVAIAGTDYAFLTPDLVYDTGSVSLFLRRNDISFANFATDDDQGAVADALQSLPQANALRDRILLVSADAAPQAYDALGGEIHGSTGSVIVENDLRLRDVYLSSADTTLEGLSVWGQAFGSWGDFDGDGAARTSADLKGLGAGVSFGWGPAAIGVGGGYADGRAQADGGFGKSDIDTTFVGAIASLDLLVFDVQAGLSYAWHDVATDRVAAFGGFSDALDSEYSGHSVIAYAEAAYTLLDLGVVSLSPVAGYSFISFDSDSFAENGGDAALTVSNGDRDVHLATLGLRLDGDAGVPMLGGVSPHAELRWQHGWGDREGVATSTFLAGGDAFSVAGQGIARDQLLIDLGLAADLGGVRLGASYLGAVSADFQQHGGQVTLAVPF